MALDTRISEVLAKAIVSHDSKIRVSSQVLKVVTKNASPYLRASMVTAKVVAGIGPDFIWLEDDMFKDIRFPEEISYGSSGGPAWETQVSRIASGYDQRIGNWSEPLRKFNVSLGIHTREQLHEVLKFHMVAEGKKYSFRYKDWTDFNSAGHTSQEIDATSPTDQLFFTSDGILDFAQLIKTYEFAAGFTHVRKITKPVVGTLTIYEDGSPFSLWSCDYLSGIITFLAPTPVVGTDIYADDEGAGVYTFKSTSSDLSVFSNGQKIVTDGFTDSENLGPFIVQAAPTTNRMVVLHDLRPTQPVIDAAAGPSITISHTAAPTAGKDYTAGYEFDVPARFDTDEMSTQLDSYGVGSSNLEVIEVRPENE
jgi:uncharacterized protein (TIGR02217 family)